MRKILSLCLVLLLTGNISQAQIRLGLKVAPQITWAASDNKNTSSNGTRINMAYGLMVDYYFAENYAIGTELCMNTFGANVNLSKDKYTKVEYQSVDYPNTGAIQYDYKLQYIQIPVLLKMRTAQQGNIRYYAEFGFGLGFIYRSKADITFGSKSLSNVDVNEPDPSDVYTIHTINFKDDVSTVRSSMIIGAGIHYQLGTSSSLVVGLRYDNGLSSSLVDERWRTTLHYIGLNLGLIF